MNCNIETQVVFCCLCCRKIQRLCKARAEAKFTWIMPSRRQFSCKRVQSRTCSGYAERSRKCQEKVHLYELSVVFPRILYARRAERQLQVVKKLS